jgi:hypothetical protein
MTTTDTPEMVANRLTLNLLDAAVTEARRQALLDAAHALETLSGEHFTNGHDPVLWLRARAAGCTCGDPALCNACGAILCGDCEVGDVARCDHGNGPYCVGCDVEACAGCYHELAIDRGATFIGVRS